MLTLLLAFSEVRSTASAGIVYQTDFDSLDLGQTTSYPGSPGQGGWMQNGADGDAFGEIQDSIANGGRALHEHTASTLQTGLQTIDSRFVGPVSLANVGVVSLSIDFYGSSSDLSAVNSFSGAFYAVGGPHPGFQIIGFELVAGNGAPKSDTGLNIKLDAFDGLDNNGPIPLNVGQNLAWNEWHTASLSIDQRTDTWLSITVDGQTQSLLGYAPMRSFDGPDALRGQLIERLDAQISPDNLGGTSTNDDVYFDNIRLSTTVVPEPASTWILLGVGALALAGVRRRSLGNK
ncbi:MAG: PEP-CTERM sorting domain-containing protein [Planctomycetes bacterium]|nr:PEP-CTERM sorting domain-containing protein [Planctomycetota bacterium]